MKKILIIFLAAVMNLTFICGAVFGLVKLANSAPGSIVYDQLVWMKKNLRVDGLLYSKKKYGKTPLRIADNLLPAKNNKSNLGSAKKYWKNGYLKNLYLNDLQGEAVNTDNLAANSVTQSSESYGTATQTTTNSSTYDYITEQVTLTTTGNSTLFCTFSGVLNSNTNGSQARIILVVDGQPITQSIRRGTSMLVGTENRTFTLATNALVNVTAGTHTVQVGWNTDYATTAYMYNHTLDVIELKK